eukprot:m.848488 g.848488  ORF g.848488 m.848488 type:complete len:91 (-) comp23488_c0_seq3:1940-2212(-)
MPAPLKIRTLVLFIVQFCTCTCAPRQRLQLQRTIDHTCIGEGYSAQACYPSLIQSAISIHGSTQQPHASVSHCEAEILFLVLGSQLDPRR